MNNIYTRCSLFSSNVDLSDDKGNTALSYALQGNHGLVASYLLSLGASWKNLPPYFSWKVVEDAIRSLTRGRNGFDWVGNMEKYPFLLHWRQRDTEQSLLHMAAANTKDAIL